MPHLRSPADSATLHLPSGRSNLSYRTKLIAGVCGLVILTGLTITWLSYRSAQASTSVLVHARFREVSEHAVTHTRAFMLRAAPLVESLVQLSDKGLALADSDRLADQLLAILKGNPGLSWVSYGDEQGNFTGAYRPIGGGLRINQSRIVDGHTRLIEHDILSDGSRKVSNQNGDSGYDPRKRPFYVKAKKEGRLVWLPPYLFYNQSVPGISCAAPVYDAHRQLRGVLTIDFDLTALSEFVSHVNLSEHSTVFLYTADEVLLAHPSQRSASAGSGQRTRELPTLQSIADPLIEAYRSHPRGKGEVDGDFTFFEFDQERIEYLASATMFHVGDDLTWVVGAVAPKADFLSGIWRSQAQALIGTVVALVIAVILAAWMARRVSGPVLDLIGFMNRVGAGDLEAHADFSGSLEFQQLTNALNRMIADLRDRAQLRHSLNLAMEVQQRLLPQKPPQVVGLDIAGHSTYCDETGGDYFDYLVLDKASPHQLLLAIGDVMGHGIAAALVMASARAVLHDRADAAGTLPDLIGRLNRMLAADHEGNRFMTMHLGVLDSRTGMYRWVSAGHDPAILYDPAKDRFEEIDVGDMPLGIMDDLEFTEHSLGPLQPGQVVFVGTDGVWELPNAQNEPFGKDRLRQALRETAAEPAERIAGVLRERIIAFRGAVKPVDDITFVIVKYLPPT
jgi:serine phosphatase RsbU (regulator of sigma subunit)